MGWNIEGRVAGWMGTVLGCSAVLVTIAGLYALWRPRPAAVPAPVVHQVIRPAAPPVEPAPPRTDQERQQLAELEREIAALKAQAAARSQQRAGDVELRCVDGILIEKAGRSYRNVGRCRN